MAIVVVLVFIVANLVGSGVASTIAGAATYFKLLSVGRAVVVILLLDMDQREAIRPITTVQYDGVQPGAVHEREREEQQQKGVE